MLENKIIYRSNLDKGIKLVDILVDSGLATSKSDAKRLIQQRAIKVFKVGTRDIPECYLQTIIYKEK